MNTFSIPAQAAVFFSVYAGLFLTTFLGIQGLHTLKASYPSLISSWEQSWGLIGFLLASGGVAHFFLTDDFSNIMPAKGTWGFWYLPGSARFHVLWTGVAEILLGTVLGVETITSFLNIPSFFSAFNIWTTPLSDAAFLFFLLVVLMTPANIYMVRLRFISSDTPVVYDLYCSSSLMGLCFLAMALR